MPRPCTVCVSKNRIAIDKALAAGEPVAAVAAKFGVPLRTLHRHRGTCAGIKAPPRAEQIDRTRGTVLLASLPSREELGSMYRTLAQRIDGIVAQAEEQGSLAVAVQGLNALKGTLDSMGKFAGLAAPETQVNVAVAVGADAIAAALTKALAGRDVRTIEGAVCDDAES